MTTEQKTFIESIAAAARKHAANYGIAVISPIIAQKTETIPATCPQVFLLS